MFVLINGSFGIGKTTVARELRARLKAAIYDPEIAGLALQRLPGLRVPDFQDLPAWRRLTVAGAKAVGWFRPIVIIPMAFSNRSYLDEVRDGLLRTKRPVSHFCLTAPLPIIQERIAKRGTRDDGERSWVLRRAEECCTAHEDRAFAIHIPTEARSPAAIADDIVSQLG